MAQITFEYYTGESRRRPHMSSKLWLLIQAAVAQTGASKCHIVHAGTVASKAHYKRNPKSRHSGVPPTPPPQKHPPEALDATKIYLKWKDGRELELFLTDSLPNRRLVAAVWKEVGGQPYHENDPDKNHVHLET